MGMPVYITLSELTREIGCNSPLYVKRFVMSHPNFPEPILVDVIRPENTKWRRDDVLQFKKLWQRRAA